MATDTSILAWRIPWMEEPGGPMVHGVAESDKTEVTKQQQQRHACNWASLVTQDGKEFSCNAGDWV